MSIDSQKIAALSSPISDLPDKIVGNAAYVKGYFDANPEQLKDAHNDLIDFLKSTTTGDSAAANIGSEAISGVTGTTVRAQIASVKGQIPTAVSQLTNDSNFIAASGAPVQSVSGKTGSVSLTKGDVGLGNVDNTSDANKPVSTAQQAALDLKVDKVGEKGLSTEDYTTAEKSKLSGIEAEANKYVHPSTHSADIIVDGTTNKAYTAAEKTKLANLPEDAASALTELSDVTIASPVDGQSLVYDGTKWTNATGGGGSTPVIDNLASTSTTSALSANQGRVLNDGKVDKVTGKGLSTEDYTTNEKTKLAGIAENANNYVHPSTHSADIITDGTTNKAYTAVEKTKLAGIATGAQVNPASTDYLTEGSTNLYYTDARVLAYIRSGWLPAGGSFTLNTSDSPTFILSTSVDLTSYIGVGDKFKCLSGATQVYAIVTAITSSAITLFCGTDYSISSTITQTYYSKQKSPYGFPMSKGKWKVEVVSTSEYTQASPTSGTWYNVGSKSISVPIGAWDLEYSGLFESVKGSAPVTLYGSLSTSNSSVSDTHFSFVTYISGTATQEFVTYKHKDIVVSSKTPYYLILMTDQSGTTSLKITSLVPLIFRAYCSYL